MDTLVTSLQCAGWGGGEDIIDGPNSTAVQLRISATLRHSFTFLLSSLYMHECAVELDFKLILKDLLLLLLLLHVFFFSSFQQETFTVQESWSFAQSLAVPLY